MNKKIAIIADWLIDFAGAELVISHLLEMYPEADIFTSVCYMDHPMLEGRKVYTSWIQKIPFFNRNHKLAGLLRPWAFRSFDLSNYDFVICSSSAESKQVALGKWNSTRHVDNRRHPAQDTAEQDFSLRSKGQNQETKTDSSLHSEGQKRWNTSQSQSDGNKKPRVIVYCHTPIRYYWSHAKEYEDMLEFGMLNPLVKLVFRLVKKWMQKVDFEAAQKVDYFIANSKTTAERIKKYYHRDAIVIYPGVELVGHYEERSNPENKNGISESNWIASQGSQGRNLEEGADSSLRSEGQELDSQTSSGGMKQESYYLGLGRCIPYKRFDLLVNAFNENGKKLILCTSTDTKLYHELKEKSKPNIEWKFRVSNEEKMELMANAEAFLFPPEEDFGLVPVESMMVGTPVIAYGKGGAMESIIEGETGMFFTPQTPEALNSAIKIFEKGVWKKEDIMKYAEQFSKEVFQKKIYDFIDGNIRIQ